MVISFEEKDSGRIINIKKSEKFSIALKENASTGYTWLEELDPVKNVISLEGEEYIISNSVTGSTGTHLWMYIANQVGRRILKFHYQRPWDQESVKTFEITINVHKEF